MNRLKPLATKKHHSFLILLILSLCLLQSACSSSNNNSQENPTKPSNTNQSKEASPTLDLTPYLSESKPTLFNIEGVKFYKDVPYKKKGDAKQKFDFYMPESKNTTGLVIFYHGGGFIRLDKRQAYEMPSNNGYVKSKFADPLGEILKSGIAVASVNYRFIKQETSTQPAVSVETPLEDMRYFLQFARYYANSLNIDASRIVLSGESAGASTALLIGLDRDEVDINAKDPILRQSMEVKGLALWDMPASMNLQEIMTVFPDNYGLSGESSLFESQAKYIPEFTKSMLRIYGAPESLYAIPSGENEKKELANKIKNWITSNSKVEILSHRLSIKTLMTSDDPELWIENIAIANTDPQYKTDLNEALNILYHHPVHARKLHSWAKEKGIKSQSCYRVDKAGEQYKIECYDSDNIKMTKEKSESMVNFVKRKLKN